MYKMVPLLEETSWVNLRLKSQARHQPTFPAALLRLIQSGFNESFRQALERRKRVRWPKFKSPEGLSQPGIFGRTWSPSQGGWHL